MSVYVDGINDYSPLSSVGEKARKYGTRWCFMYADTEEELHAMACDLGLLRKWCNTKRTWFICYNLTESKRQKALALGAVDDSNHKVLGAWSRERIAKANKDG